MQKITSDLLLDFQHNNSGKIVCIQQGDAEGGRVISVKLYNNGVAVNLSDSGDTAKLYASTEGIVTVDGDSLDIDHSTSVISVPITEALSAIAGEEKCVIRITSSSGVVNSARFSLLVGPSPVSEGMATVDTTTIGERLAKLEQYMLATHLAFGRINGELKMLDRLSSDLQDEVFKNTQAIAKLRSDFETFVNTTDNDFEVINLYAADINNRLTETTKDANHAVTAVGLHANRITDLQQNMKTNTQDVANLKLRMTRAEADIDVLESEIGNNGT